MTSLKVRLGNHSAPSSWVAQTPCATPKPHHLQLWVAGGLSAVAAHCLLILAMLMSPSTKRIELLSAPAAPASVRVTMIAAPTPQLPPAAEAAPVAPTPPAPQVMTSEAAERTVAAALPKPTKPAAPKPPMPAKPPRAPVAPHTPAPTQPAGQAPAVSPAAPVTAPPAESPGKTLQLPAAAPKDVNTIGCRVPAPEYPRKAKRLKIEGETLIRLVVNAQGRIDQAEIARSAGNADLDAAARQAVLGASCAPYIENGHAVAVRALQPVSFRLTR